MSLALCTRTTAVPLASLPDRILVVGGGPRTLDLLRMAVIRSDQVALIAPDLEAPVRRFVDLFAIEAQQCCMSASELRRAAAVLASSDIDTENRLVRSARRLGVPVHIADRPLVSDFTLIELVERHPASIAGEPVVADRTSGPPARWP